ncbi:transcriptional antiterminator, Rof [Sulfuricella sp.]|uniref:transcriptional antiterminator, Rof n=1 Tax=Sulfuricella sp. TaxID=2099377 RepID=UPI002CF3A7AF|nr:transcriptional antiterminator, Rof [Sulfuricella sp.]HUX62723.1 transcriptional antiterminator, Rof [Sulfuricella sp.]
MEQEYLPIACMQHERLEFSVLRRIPLMLECRSEGPDRVEKVMPLDVTTRDGAEWLKFRREDSSEEEIRLDWISSFEEVLA